jgi:hypothetical protein
MMLVNEEGGVIEINRSGVRFTGKNKDELLGGEVFVFMSGYTADIIARHGVLDPGVNFIQKPFSMKNLAAKVRESLDDAQKSSQ